MEGTDLCSVLLLKPLPFGTLYQVYSVWVLWVKIPWHPVMLLTVCLLKGLHWNSLALFWRQSSFGWRLCVWWNLGLGSLTAWSPPPLPRTPREKHCKWIYWLCQSFPYRGRWCFSVLLQTIAQGQPILGELNNTVGVIQFTSDFLPRYHNTTEHLGVVPSLLPLFTFASIWSHDLMCWNCLKWPSLLLITDDSNSDSDSVSELNKQAL